MNPPLHSTEQGLHSDQSLYCTDMILSGWFTMELEEKSSGNLRGRRRDSRREPLDIQVYSARDSLMRMKRKF